MSIAFSKLPSAARISPVPFSVSIPAGQLADLKSLVQLSRIAPPTYENSQPDGRFGITSEWLSAMREKWLTEFDWSQVSPGSIQLQGLTLLGQHLKLG